MAGRYRGAYRRWRASGSRSSKLLSNKNMLMLAGIGAAIMIWLSWDSIKEKAKGLKLLGGGSN